MHIDSTLADGSYDLVPATEELESEVEALGAFAVRDTETPASHEQEGKHRSITYVYFKLCNL